MDGIACDHRPAAGEGAGSPVEFTCIACDNAHIAHRYPQLFSNDLSKGRKVTLPLGANARRYQNLAADFDRHAGAFIGTNACRLDKGGDTNAHISPLSAKPRLLIFDEFVIAYHFQSFFHHRPVVPTIQDEGRKGLINDLVLIWKSIRRNKIALADFYLINSQLFGSDI